MNKILIQQENEAPWHRYIMTTEGKPLLDIEYYDIRKFHNLIEEINEMISESVKEGAELAKNIYFKKKGW